MNGSGEATQSYDDFDAGADLEIQEDNSGLADLESDLVNLVSVNNTYNKPPNAKRPMSAHPGRSNNAENTHKTSRASGRPSTAKPRQSANNSDKPVQSLPDLKQERLGLKTPAPLRPLTPSSRGVFSHSAYSRPSSARPLSASARRSSSLPDHDAEADGPITRRYFTEGVVGPDGRSVVMSNFNVRLAQSEASTTQRMDYIRVYYTDTLGAEPQKSLIEPGQRTIDVEVLSKWLLECAPRTRLDALPQLLLTQEMFRRFMSADIAVISAKEIALGKELEESRAYARSLEEELRQAHRQLEDKEESLQKALQEKESAQAMCSALEHTSNLCEKLEAKIADMKEEAKKMQDNFTERLELAKQDAKKKTEAIWEKKAQIMKYQIEQHQSQMDKATAEMNNLKAQKEETSKKMKELSDLAEKAKADPADRIKTAAEILRIVKMFPDAESTQVLRGMTSLPGPFFHISTSEKHVSDHTLTTISGFLEQVYFARKHALKAAQAATNVGDDDDDSDKGSAADSSDEENANNQAKSKEDGTGGEGEGGGGVEGKPRGCIQQIISELPEEIKWELLGMLVRMSQSGSKFEDDTEGTYTTLLESILGRCLSLETIVGLLRETSGGIHKIIAERKSELKRQRTESKMLQKKLKRSETELHSTIQRMSELEQDFKGSGSKPDDKQQTDSKQQKGPLRPRVLAVYYVPPKLRKASTVIAIPTLLQTIGQLYESKAIADKTDDEHRHPRQAIPEFIRDFLVNKYGLKSIALPQLHALVVAVQKHFETDQRLKIFGRVAGILTSEQDSMQRGWQEGVCDFLLHALQGVIRTESIKESLDSHLHQNPLVETDMAIQATEQASMAYGFGQPPQELLLHLQEAAQGTMELPLYAWLDIIIEDWLSASIGINEQLVSLFHMYDSNKDGVMDLQEFREMVASFTGDEGLDERLVSKIFSAALEETNRGHGDGDGQVDTMSPEAFVVVARQHSLTGNQRIILHD